MRAEVVREELGAVRQHDRQTVAARESVRAQRIGRRAREPVERAIGVAEIVGGEKQERLVGQRVGARAKQRADRIGRPDGGVRRRVRRRGRGRRVAARFAPPLDVLQQPLETVEPIGFFDIDIDAEFGGDLAEQLDVRERRPFGEILHRHAGAERRAREDPAAESAQLS